jgi:hypothetical protein
MLSVGVNNCALLAFVTVQETQDGKHTRSLCMQALRLLAP